MCKTRTITYSCSCTITFRLSSCHGAYTATPRRQPNKPVTLCKSVPTLAFKSSSKCGPCTKEPQEEMLASEMTTLRRELTPTWGAEASDEDLERLADAENKYEAEKYQLDRKFPDGRFKKSGNCRKSAGQQPSPTALPAVETEPPKRRKASLLREEVLPEHVIAKYDPNTTSYSGNWNDESTWGSGWGSSSGSWKSLDDEIRENDAARLEIGLTSNSTSIDAWESNGWNKVEDLAPSFEIHAPTSTSPPPASYSFEDDDYEPPDGLGFPDVEYMERKHSVVDEGYESSDAQWKENQRPTSMSTSSKRPTVQRRTPSCVREQKQNQAMGLYGLPMELAVS